VQQMCLIEDEDGMSIFLREFLYMRRDRVEERRSRGLGGEPERGAELALEVTPAKGHVMAIGQPEVRGTQTMTERP